MSRQYLALSLVLKQTHTLLQYHHHHNSLSARGKITAAYLSILTHR